MALSPAAPDRQPRHGRCIDAQGPARPDGRRKVDATPFDAEALDGMAARGRPRSSSTAAARCAAPSRARACTLRAAPAAPWPRRAARPVPEDAGCAA